MIGVAVVGVGYWGPGLVRNLSAVKDAEVLAICDQNVARARDIGLKFAPRSKPVADVRAIAQDPAIQAVVIATPIRTHFELGQLFLTHGKHVFIEKPLAATSRECQALIDLAEKHRRVLMVGHVFEYNSAVRYVKKVLQSGDLGKLFYVYSQRLNLGRIQTDTNAMWSFAPHDVSIINAWVEAEPVRVSARGFSYLTQGIEDVTFAVLEYPGGVGVHLHLSWLDPCKVRQMTLVGSKKMLVYDDVSSDSRIQIYDKGVNNLHDYLESPSSFAEFRLQLRSGDLLVPSIDFEEPLQIECRHFIECIQKNAAPLTDGWNGYRVVRVLEALDASMKANGAWIDVGPTR